MNPDSESKPSLCSLCSLRLNPQLAAPERSEGGSAVRIWRQTESKPVKPRQSVCLYPLAFPPNFSLAYSPRMMHTRASYFSPMEQIVILDFGSQFTQVIARRIRECRVYSTILRYDTPASTLAALAPKGLILSGGPSSVYDPKAPLPDPAIFKLGVPILGICYGVQLLTHFLGGKVEPGQKREYGKGTLSLKEPSAALFANLPDRLQIWNSHGDKLTRLPKGFRAVAASDNSEFAAIEDTARNFHGLQFHPEVAHTPRGREIIVNFVHGICGCGKEWTMRRFIDQAVEEIQAQLGGERVILGLSGGVDSSVSAALLHKAVGKQLTCIFVNNGLLRAGEAEVVREVFTRHFKIKLQYRNASRLFLGRLKGVTDPERKRKIIGRTFIKVFAAAARARAAPSSSRRARFTPMSSSRSPSPATPPP